MPETWTLWQVVGHDLTNPEFIEQPAQPLVPEFPMSVWRCDPLVDGGEVSCPLFPDWVQIKVKQVFQLPYIQVYAMLSSAANYLLYNGLAILQPTMCEETEELCGMWSVDLEHPIDPENKWKLLVEGNVLKVNEQLFTIKRTEEVWEGATGYVRVYAEHIWYQLADNWIFATPFDVKTIEAKTCASAINQIMALSPPKTIPGGIAYSFHGTSNMPTYETTFYAALDSGCTPIEMILGENGIIAAKGGELHRDNFNFSINTRKQGASDHAADIRIGKNLTGIKRTIDTSTMCTYLEVTDAGTGNGKAIGWDTAVGSQYGVFFPHHVARSEVINIPDGIQFRFEYLGQYTQALFATACMPIISYEISIEDVRMNPDFEIIADEKIRCGDIVRVIDYRLGGDTGGEMMLEVTGTVYDRITGKCKSITIGNKQSFVYHPTQPILYDQSGEPIHPVPLWYEVWVQDATGRYLYDANGVKIIITEGED